MTFENVDPAVAGALLEQGWQVLDVRELWEVAAGGIEGAVLVPLGQLPERVSELDAPGYVAVCRIGARSADACHFLTRHGIECVNLSGGMHAWAGAGNLLTTAEGLPGQVA